MTADLVTFLRARLDEDEQVARATHPVFQAWEYDTSVREVRDLGNGNELASGVLPPYGAHIARHDPARVLAEVEAKRRIVDVHHVVGGWQDEDLNDHGPGCEECGHSEEYSDRGGWCETLRLLALPYAAHPDYREEWRP
ncbi:DUF6221 family protein [Streptomyces smyrnaeus]|uniref:DUF6221 family protein n=1 Tax=Streptomyces smyrnaeus TaxID=1387713 RepID=UPI0033CF53F6